MGRVDRLDRIQPHPPLQRRHPSSRSTSSDHRKIGLLRGPALPIPKSSWEQGQHTPALIRPAGALLWDAVEVPAGHLCLDADEIISAGRQPLRLFPRVQLLPAATRLPVLIPLLKCVSAFILWSGMNADPPQVGRWHTVTPLPDLRRRRVTSPGAPRPDGTFY